MPYITDDSKTEIMSKGLKEINAGQLNYTLTQLIKGYLGTNFNYQRINDVLGALEGAKLEFYRRVVVPYEETKILANGDVYETKK